MPAMLLLPRIDQRIVRYQSIHCSSLAADIPIGWS